MFAINHLNGFGAFTSTAAVTSMSFHDVSYSGDSASATMPAGSIAGDLLIFSDAALNSAGSRPALVTPAGFTNWINLADVSDNTRHAVSYKIADGTETTVTGMDGTGADDKILAVFRPNVPITTITASTPTTQATASNPTAQNINADGAGTLPLIAFGFYLSGSLGSAIDPRTMSPAATGELYLDFEGSGIHFIKYQLQNVALADVSVDMDDEGTDNMLSSGFLWFS